MRLERLTDLLQRWARRPAAFFLAYTAWLCLERVLLGPASYLEIHDIGDSMIPRNMAVARDLLAHGPSYWLPSIIGGLDRLAQTHSYLSPSISFFLVFPPWIAHALALGTGLFLASYFTFRVCREHLGLGAEAALYAGVANVWVYDSELLITQWGFAAVPLMVWLLDRVEERGPARALTAGLLYSWATVFATSLPFGLVGIAGWFLFVRRKTAPRFWLHFALFSLASLILQVQQVWALLANLPFAQRSVADLGLASRSSDLPGVLLAATLSLRAYPLSLAWGGIALVTARPRDRRVTACLLLLVGAVIGAALLRFSATRLPDTFAMFRAYNFGRFNQLAPFFAACAGALGLQLLGERLGPRARHLPTLSILLLFLAYIPRKAICLRSWLFEGSAAANYDSRALREALPAPGSEPFRVASVLHGIYPFYANAHGWDTADGEGNLYPRRYNLLWSKLIEPSASLRPALAGQLDDFKRVGTRVQLSLDTVEHEPEGLVFSRYYRRDLLSLLNTRYIVSRHPLIDPDLRPLRTQRPWSEMTRRERILLRVRENFKGKSYFYVYENTGALPRYFVAPRFAVGPAGSAFWDRLAETPVEELQRTVLLEAPLTLGSRPLKSASVRELSRSPDRIELELTSDGAGVLVASNSYSPFWHCRVDGTERTVVPAYGALWGVPVGAADRRVVFTYEPPYRLDARW